MVPLGSGLRARRWPVIALLVAMGALGPHENAWAGPGEGATKERGDLPHAGESRIGPLWVSDASRRRVRGDRPPNASLEIAFASPVRTPDAALQVALREFERAELGEDVALPKTTETEPPDAWMRALEVPGLTLRWTPRLVKYLRYFRDDPKGQALARAWLERMNRHADVVHRVLDDVGVPRSIAVVALVESGFDPKARSGVGAAGLWQFMEQTGRVYGLHVEYWRDDRLDVERSTYAAATYLDDLRARFGSWELALAAYNAGYGLVVKTIRDNNSNDFWTLANLENGLPHQTMNYVPKILAMAAVAHNREAFGIDVPAKSAAPWVEVSVAAGVRLSELAKAIDVDATLLTTHNARYVRGRIDPSGGPAPVMIPRDRMAAFEKTGSQLRAAEQGLTTYQVRLGDDLESLGRRFHTTPKALRKLNGVHDSGELRGGVTIVVPKLAAGTAPLAADPPIVAVPALDVPKGQRKVFLRITRATLPREVAAAVGVDWKTIVAWNGSDPSARLVDGQMLQLLVPKTWKADDAGVRVHEESDVVHVLRGSRAHLDAVLSRRELVRRGYVVREGESLARIGKKFKLSLGSIARINGVARSHQPAADDVLVVYVAKGKTKGTVKAPPTRTETVGDETRVVSGWDPDAAPSTADTAKLPGRRRTP